MYKYLKEPATHNHSENQLPGNIWKCAVGLELPQRIVRVFFSDVSCQQGCFYLTYLVRIDFSLGISVKNNQMQLLNILTI